MQKKIMMATVVVILFSGLLTLQLYGQQTNFQPAVFSEIGAAQIRPEGWLKRQLEIMRDGSTGHLDEVYVKVKNDNGWLGGKGDGWEETPYWLDGAVPLAYLLNDTSLKKKVQAYIDWTITNQRPSGYFGPITKWERETGKQIDIANANQGEDWWPKMVMLKVIQQYYLASKDQRVIPFMQKYFNYQLAALPKVPLGKWTEWATSRGADNVLMVQWLYGVHKDPNLLKLADILSKQSFPWSRWLGDGQWIVNTTSYRNSDTLMNRHAVNVAMGLKFPAVDYQRSGNKKYIQDIRKGFHDLMLVHGLPMGSFSGDEDLSGNDPVQGTELCAIVEDMYSLERTTALTGATKYADALERLAFNALPPQTTDDYNNKQYFQVANQVQISRGVFNFSLPFDRQMCNVLGMRSGYTCCLANMHQGWTKFASHLWYGTKDGGLAALIYSPNTLTTTLGKNKVPVTIREVTDYPFSDKIRFEISIKKTAAFPLQLRIPKWCKAPLVTINGHKNLQVAIDEMITINRNWKNGDVLELQLPMEISTSVWGRNSRAVERGPLVYGLKLKERWEKGNDQAEGDYFSVYPADKWNYAIPAEVISQTTEKIKVEHVKPIGYDFVWNQEHAPIELRLPARQLPDWKEVNGVAFQPVNDREGIYKGSVAPEKEEIVLVPFGFTKVRIVAFPVVK
jgi:hypothetical protein